MGSIPSRSLTGTASGPLDRANNATQVSAQLPATFGDAEMLSERRVPNRPPTLALLLVRTRRSGCVLSHVGRSCGAGLVTAAPPRSAYTRETCATPTTACGAALVCKRTSPASFTTTLQPLPNVAAADPCRSGKVCTPACTGPMV